MKILVADNDPVSRRALKALLAKWDYEVTAAGDGDSAWRLLQANDAPRLAVLDWTMPGLDGVEICRRLRRSTPEPYTYILLLTARGDKAEIVQGLESGADDYLTKPFDPQELKARLRTGRRALAILDSLLGARDALRHQAGLDPLTGLMSRVTALDALAREIARSDRRGSPLSVILADLDEFESVNLTYGNLSGDAVLREIARRVKAVSRPYDLVGRFGSRQFLIVLPECDLEASRKYAERLHQTLNAPYTNFVEGRLQLSASLGLATGEGGRFHDGDTSEQTSSLLRAADAALRRAKLSGKSRTEVATPMEFLLSYAAISPRSSSRISREKN